MARLIDFSKTNAVNAGKCYHVSLYRQDGTLRYSGQMTGHRKEGWGTEYCPKGKSTYVGNWQQGKRHGHGTHTVFYPQSQRPCQRYTGLYTLYWLKTIQKSLI